MENTRKIEVGNRLYRYVTNDDGTNRKIKGEVSGFSKNIFGKTRVKVDWDDGRKGRYSEKDVIAWIELRETEHEEE